MTRYWDRITHPAQVLQSLPAAIATMLDPADCAPAFIALPQDVQGWTLIILNHFLTEECTAPSKPDKEEISSAAELLMSAKRPIIMLVAAQYSGAVSELTNFAKIHNIPIVETQVAQSFRRDH